MVVGWGGVYMEGRGGQVELSEVSQDCNSDQRSGRAGFSLEYALFVSTPALLIFHGKQLSVLKHEGWSSCSQRVSGRYISYLEISMNGFSEAEAGGGVAGAQSFTKKPQNTRDWVSKL